ncbi:hypothetical protein L1887_35487 [Cichorium endivia]|nr:hypothetical protein L1887_35487 [Cichorium endivia]
MPAYHCLLPSLTFSLSLHSSSPSSEDFIFFVVDHHHPHDFEQIITVINISNRRISVSLPSQSHITILLPKISVSSYHQHEPSEEIVHTITGIKSFTVPISSVSTYPSLTSILLSFIFIFKGFDLQINDFSNESEEIQIFGSTISLFIPFVLLIF